jgi:peptide/nickel transport system ATP-binding protein
MKIDAMPIKPIIAIEGLSARFGKEGENEVLYDITFSVQPGETLAIVGESGSGKSLTSLTIMRLIDSPPITYPSGTVFFSTTGTDLLQSKESEMRPLRGARIAMVFQEPMTSLNPLKRCGEQVAEAIRLHKNIKAKEADIQVIALFNEVLLPDPERAFSSYPHELSGGQKQRVMIALAISCDPELLIADEPTTALDVTVQREIIDLLKRLQAKSGMAMIFISHDLAVVSQIADRVLVMKSGEIVESGEIKSLISNPQHPYTQGLLASRPPLNSRPIRLQTVSDYLLESTPDMLLETSSEREDRQTALYAQSPILEVRDLHTWYPIKSGVLQRVTSHVKAVNGVSLDLYPGETLGLVGESGCGKSTLGRTILGLETSKSGSIHYKGQDTQHSTSVDQQLLTREVQMIFQDPYSSLNPRQAIGEAIREPMIVHRLNGTAARQRKSVESLLERVGLEAEHYNRYPHEFSGGQRQRICIARTLAMSPRVIICDESVSALDVSVQAQVLNLLKDLQAEFGLSYLFISHDLSVVRYISDRVMVMHGGLVIETAEADELYNSPQKEYTRSLISSAYSID